MTREDLFRAIGEADESQLSRTEENSASNMTALEDWMMEMNEKKRRPLRLILVAAAVIMLLAVTVVASEGIAGIWHKEAWTVYTPTDASGNSQMFTERKYEVLIELDRDAPAEIQTYYLPQMPEGYTQTFGNLYGGTEELRRTKMECDWADAESRVAVRFIQVSKEAWERGNETVVYTYNDATEISQVRLGGVDGLLISVPDAPTYPQKHFYWDDGESVFHLIFAWHITEEEMAAIISSVRVVEDIRPYMISAEDQSILDALLNR